MTHYKKGKEQRRDAMKMQIINIMQYLIHGIHDKGSCASWHFFRNWNGINTFKNRGSKS